MFVLSNKVMMNNVIKVSKFQKLSTCFKSSYASLCTNNKFYPKKKEIKLRKKESNDPISTSSNLQTYVAGENEPKANLDRNSIVDTSLRGIEPGDKDFKESRPGEELKFVIFGQESQLAVIDIHPGKVIRSESAKLKYMSEGVDFQASSMGFMSGIKRMFTGSTFFMTEYTYSGNGVGKVGFSENYPSKIIPIRLNDYNGNIICQKGAYICGTSDIEMNIEFTKKFSTGFLGGEGFILQRISGTGTCLVNAGGSLIKKKLKEGEKIRVERGMLICFESTVNYEVELVGGLKKMFGVGSMFFATLTGPGEVYLQTMHFDNLVEEIEARIGSVGGSSIGGGRRSSAKGDSNEHPAKDGDEKNPSEGVEGKTETEATPDSEVKDAESEVKDAESSENSGFFGSLFGSNAKVSNNENDVSSTNETSDQGFLDKMTNLFDGDGGDGGSDE